jgi:lantibiotic leader peptide-processing serine protease
MTTTWGIRDWRAGQICRRLVLVAAASSASVLASCSDGPVTPPAARAVLAALPSAPRYVTELPAAGAPSAALAVQIREGGGRIVYSHAGTGIVVVAGLSAKSATALRLRNDVQAVVADLRRMRITDPAFRRMQVRSVKPSATHSRSFTPGSGTDPRTAQFFGQQWNMTVIQADTAWQITSQGAGEKVFILDTGVDTDQVDLVGRVNTSLSTSFAFATDTSTQPLPFSHDVVSHGSFVSSQIATNSLGIAAVAPQAQLVMVRVLNDSGEGSFSANLEGILYATDSGANVINMSLGGYFDRTSADDMSFVDVFQRVVDYAFQRGILLVAAAGNSSEDFNTATSPFGSYADSLNAPAGLHHVLSVGATGPVDEKNFDTIADYSNYGNDGVAVFAPGGNSADTLPSDSSSVIVDADLVIGACSSASALCPGKETEYLIGDGTSFASPIVAGEAAVVQGQHTTVVGQALETCIATTSTEVTGKRPDPNYGFGRVNVFTAVTSGSCK